MKNKRKKSKKLVMMNSISC